MGDSYWRYGDVRQQPGALPPPVAKRPRPEYEMPSTHDMPSYYAREDDRGGHRVIRDTGTINASYDHYLRSAQIASYGGDPGRSTGIGHGGPHNEDPRVLAMARPDPAVAARSRSMGVGGKPEIPLPPDASNTLFVEGLPANCTRREVSHIFRPFVGYKEVRLVTKESRHSGGDPLVLCFVDFQSPAHAATAMDAIQGNAKSPCVLEKLAIGRLSCNWMGCNLWLLRSHLAICSFMNGCKELDIPISPHMPSFLKKYEFIFS